MCVNVCQLRGVVARPCAVGYLPFSLNDTNKNLEMHLLISHSTILQIGADYVNKGVGFYIQGHISERVTCSLYKYNF